ncbi:conjugative coupling factor TraD, PFGI-1 class [Salmonella enterica subsp. enterica serovar Kottbus]|nr:conjugative coupling factor TraD, PFGI-1 class [Salmonella enterica subsp. enterica serovar Kottbus]EHN5888400.1 type IV conjugative transfer system coupling protein TraD [Salmonella enterica subsp. enterica serovar Newport]
MSDRYVMEALLRPAVELNTAVAAGCAAFVCVSAPWAVALSPTVSYVTAGGFAVLSSIRARQGLRILRYRRNLKRLPRYVMTSRQVPVSRHRLFLGKGFMWEQKHLQRLLETRRPEVQAFLQPSLPYRLARATERWSEYRIPALSQLLRTDSRLNPVRPLPPTGGNPAIHGVGPEERDVTMDLGERVGHMLVLGTTRVGKTRLAELLITQDIRRGNITIVFDPKGDADLLKRIWAEAHRAGREDELSVFHLGWPEVSARYNGIGRFGRTSEVPTRLANQLSGEGNSAAFKEFAWRVVNIIAQALVALGERPDYNRVRRYVMNITGLHDRYVAWFLQAKAPHLLAQIDMQVELLRQIKQNAGAPEALLRKAATEQVLDSEEVESLNDTILESLRNAVRYDQKYFDKIVASLLPLLEKLTSGKVSALLSPDYTDMSDPRPLLDWQQVIRKKGIVYIGLDAMSDAEVASAVGNSMFADLVSVAGHIYKFGLEGDLPSDGSGKGKTKKLPISLHCDEFNELMGPEFIPMINKGGGAGIEVTAYTQTWSDIEARIGNAAKAAQVTGNFNTLVMLRVREKMTAELMTTQLPEVEVYTKTLVSGFTDISSPGQGSDFTSNTQDRVSSVRMPLLSTSELINLPKGQAFALLEGGRLWKIRMPLPSAENDAMMPPDMSAMVTAMRKNYRTGETWWPVISTLPDQVPAQGVTAVENPVGVMPGEGLNG